MAKFVFSLEPLLDIRKKVEREKQLRVAELQQQLQALARQIQQAQQDIAGQNRKLGAEQLTGRLDLAYIAHEKRYVGSLQMLIAVTLQKAAAVEKTLLGAKAELLAAARDRKVIEKLRERQHARWLEEENRKEAAAMDEIGTQLALRKMSEPE